MTAALRYDRAILTRAVGNYIQRVYVKRMVWMSLATIALVIFAFTCIDSPWLLAFTIVPAVSIPVMLVLGYWLRIRESLRRLDLLDEGRASLTATDTSLNLESAIGKSEMNWKLFSELWEFPTNHLLIYSHNQFLTLPKDQVSPEFIAFVRSKLPAGVKA